MIDFFARKTDIPAVLDVNRVASKVSAKIRRFEHRSTRFGVDPTMIGAESSAEVLESTDFRGDSSRDAVHA